MSPAYRPEPASTVAARRPRAAWSWVLWWCLCLLSGASMAAHLGVSAMKVEADAERRAAALQGGHAKLTPAPLRAAGDTGEYGPAPDGRARAVVRLVVSTGDPMPAGDPRGSEWIEPLPGADDTDGDYGLDIDEDSSYTLPSAWGLALQNAADGLRPEHGVAARALRPTELLRPPKA